MAVIQKLFRFGAVGVVGFVADAGVLLLLVKLLSLSPLPARIISFVIAASVTFALNQRFTFRMAGPFSVRRWVHYIVTTAFGAAVNIGVYHFWISNHGAAALQLALGTALGSVAAMAFNFVISSAWVFRTSPQSQTSARVGSLRH